MNSTELLDLFRTQTHDIKRPYLWSDPEIWAYMNEAQNEFCRRTEGISDSTSEACSVYACVGEPYSALHPSILNIRHAQRVSDDRQVFVANFQDIISGRLDNDYGRSRPPRLDLLPGSVDYLVIGMERNKARLVKVPEVEDTINLIIFRLPLEPIIGEDQKFEIEPVHHYSLLMWMKHLGYSKEDAETFDKTKAAEHGAKFIDYCAMAMAEQVRYKHKPRLMAYGGI